MSEINDIKKLSPEMRIKKLKELVEKRNKEIEERNKEIKEAEELAKQAEKDDADQKIKSLINVPEIEEVNIDDLFKKDEKDDLESKTADAPHDELQEVQNQALYNLTAVTPTRDIYTSAIGLYNQIKQDGIVAPEIAQQAAGVQYALNEKINSTSYPLNDEMLKQANAAKLMADKILSLYTAGLEVDDGI
jgi:hypothetical protein